MDKKQNVIVKKIKEFLGKLDFVVDKVILFGSYAKGDYREGSDVDLMIISDKFEGMKMYERGCGLYDLWYDNNKMEIDLVCLTPKEFDRKKKRVNIVKYAVEGGVEIK